METLLSRVTQHAVHLAVRSGISITTSYAVKECSKLLLQAPKGKEHQELRSLRTRLDGKIRAIAASINLVELIAARGNTSLESVLALTHDLRYRIQQVGIHLEQAAESAVSAKTHNQQNVSSLRHLVEEMQQVIARIEEAIPLIHLALVTSGVNLSTKFAGTVSPSRLLQASTFLTSADSRFTNAPYHRQQIGPTYTVKLYMLYEAHASRTVFESDSRKPTWKEVCHKARIKLWRVPLDETYLLPNESADSDARDVNNVIPTESKAGEFAYQLVIVEDLEDDGLYHDSEDHSPFDDVHMAGIRDLVPVHEVSKIFFADTGKLLGIENDGETSPVLLLKRDVHAEPPRRMLQRTHSSSSLAEWSRPDGHDYNLDTRLDNLSSTREDSARFPAEQSFFSSNWRLPADLNPDWLAFEVYKEEQTVSQSSDDSADETPNHSASRWDISNSGLSSAFSGLNLRSTLSPSPMAGGKLMSHQPPKISVSPSTHCEPQIRTSLSLLEMLLKLAALQQFRQESHLAIEDELINFFLEDSATAGAGADKEKRKRLRHAASKRVGFDPYDESPVKRRSEQYIRNAHEASNHGSPDHHELAYDHAHDYQEPIPPIELAPPSIPENAPSTYSPNDHATFHRQTPSPKTTLDPVDQTRLRSIDLQSKSPSADNSLPSASTTPPTMPTAGSVLVRRPLRSHEFGELDESTT